MILRPDGFIDTTQHVFSPKRDPSKAGKVYFGFLSTGKINAASLWKRFFDVARSQGYEIEVGIHCRHPFFGELSEYVLPDSVVTTWADTVAAHRILIRDSIRKGCDKFVLLSDSCVPLSSPNVVIESICSTDYSYVQKFIRVTYLPNDYKNLPHKLKQNYVCEQWFCADKRHFKLWESPMVNDYIGSGLGNNIGNEAYLFPLFALNKELHNVREYGYHFIHRPSARSISPKTYHPLPIRNELVKQGKFVSTGTYEQALIDNIAYKYLFGRKFAETCDFSIIERKLFK